MRDVIPAFGARHRTPQHSGRLALNRTLAAGSTLVLVGLSAFGIAVTSGLAQAQTKQVSVRPAYLAVVPGEVTLPDGREAIGVREHNVEAAARRGAGAREKARQLAATQLAARQLAARQLAARQLAARQLAVRQAAARQGVVARHFIGMRASRGTPPGARVYGSDARFIARGMLADYRWDLSEFDCLDSLWTRESGWRVTAANPSGAYGIPQALPGSKMASAGADWQTNPRTQITWGLRYIKARYGSPCGAWDHFGSRGWY